MNQDKVSQSEFLQKEEEARHGAAILLILLSLVGLDIQSRKTEEERRRATATWLAWGIPFLLLAFFVITPEQEAIRELQQEAVRPSR